MKVLLSAPRAGSSYYYEHIDRENLQLPNVYKPHDKAEFLNPDIKSEWDTATKIAWLNNEREQGREYTFKHHINYLITPKQDYYNTWFTDFYKDDHVLVLKRRDRWRWFLSFLFQDCNQWSTAGVEIGDDSYTNNIKSNWIDYDYTRSLEQFFYILKLLNSCEGTVVYYEDLTFTSKIHRQLSRLVDYESYFTNIEEIKQKFQEYNHD